MKNYIKTLLALSLVLGIALPAVADAAWYNPFSWFRAKQVAPPANIPVNPGAMPTVPKPVGTKPTTTPATPSKAPVNTPVKSPVVPPVKQPATPSPSKPTTTPDAKVVEVPAFGPTYNFLLTNFSQGFNIRTGAELFAVEAKTGGTVALGNWYVDSVTWRIDAPDMRDGDIVVSVSSKQNIVAESSQVNTLITTKLSAHVASDELSFKIGGNVPNRGRLNIVVEEISGRMKNDPTNTVYKFKGLPVAGPEISL